MSSLNDPENFAGRVNFAAFIITQGRQTSRSFDNCFENNDGDAVAAALVRRARTNERLAANLFRYISEQTATEAAERLEGQKLATAARAMRAEAKVKFDAWLAERNRCPHGNLPPCQACDTAPSTTDQARLELQAKAPMRSKGKPIEDAAHLPLFIAANEPRLI